MKLIIGCDIDGILADFNHGYAPLVTKHTGVEFPTNDWHVWPNTWYWDRQAGLEKTRENEAWTEIKKDPTFWLTLRSYPDAATFIFSITHDLPIDTDIYYVTNRTGIEVKWQTELWLKNIGAKNPTVLIAKDKAAVCKALNITHYIDDKTENCEDVKRYAPDTKGYMLARPYNNEITAVPRLSSLEEFARILIEEGNG